MMKRSWLFTLSVCLVFAWASSASAAGFRAGDVDMTLGGSVRADVGYQMEDFGDVATGQEDDRTDFFLDNGLSRLNVGAAYGDLSGFVEVGLYSSGDTTTNLRHVYFTYDMGGGSSLLIGRTWNPFAEAGPAQRLFRDNGLNGYGDLLAGRTEQIRYSWVGEGMSFDVALMDNTTVPICMVSKDGGSLAEALAEKKFNDEGEKPDEGRINEIWEEAKAEANATAEDLVAGDYVLNEITPALVVVVSVELTEGAVITPSLFYQMYEWVGKASGDKDVDVNSWGLAVDASFAVEDMMTLSGEVWYGVNLPFVKDNRRDWNGGPAATTIFGAPILNVAMTDIEDVAAWGLWLQVGVPINDMTFNAGLGYQVADTEISAATFEDEVSTMGFFINTVVDMGDNLTITPEFVWLDNGDDADKDNMGTGDNDLGSQYQLGVHFQYDF